MKTNEYRFFGMILILLAFGLLQKSYAENQNLITNRQSATDIIQQEKSNVPNLTENASESALLERIAKIEQELAEKTKNEKEKKEQDAQKPSVKIIGRVHFNGAYFNSNEASKEKVGDLQDGIELRRSRIGIAGNYLEQYNYKVEFDFSSGGTVGLKDVYGEMTQLPLLSDLRVGHFMEGISMDLLTSSKSNWFIERACISNGIAKYIGDRALGIAAGNASEKENWLWNIGFFRPVDDNLVRYKNDNDGYTITTRTATLLYENEAEGKLLHLGLGYSCNFWNDQTAMDWSGKLESSLSSPLVDTGYFTGTDFYQALIPELIWTRGALAVQSELFLIDLDNKLYGNKSFMGGYCQLGYWLTGEHFNYEKGRGVLGGIDPNDNFIRKCENGKLKTGKGAWMLGYRFAWTDLSWMNNQTAGILYTHTVGLNLQLTKYSRWMFNYIFSEADYNDASRGNANAFATSFQLHF